MSKIKLEPECHICKQKKVIIADADGLLRWKTGEYIQTALPNLSADDREFLISKTCPTCFNKWCSEGNESTV